MQKASLFLFFNLLWLSMVAQFAPPVGQIGTTAIHKDSSLFVSWATGCNVVRGYQDISNINLGYASVGDSSLALGIAGSNGVVSLGDGGRAIVTFLNPIYNGPGWDFAVFENAFSDTYLELAFVEVSSDGLNYFRFPATSNTQDTLQIGGFGSVDATKINNLAGKYRALYGTPFDLQEMSNQIGLNVNNITHIKIIDVVGCIQPQYARYDQNGRKINEPWSTPFASSGFDLDAVGVINQVVTGINNPLELSLQVDVFPNPINLNSVLQIFTEHSQNITIEFTDLAGKVIHTIVNTQLLQGWHTIPLADVKLSSGLYFIKLTSANNIITKKIIVTND